MHLRISSISFILLLFIPFITFSKDYNIVDFGAIADGKTLNTKSIQAAIDKAHADGGGRIIIPSGNFLSGSIILKSETELHLLKNGVLLGSTDPSHYIEIAWWGDLDWRALIIADSSKNVAISGKGTINGQGGLLALNIDSLFYEGQIDSSQYEFREKRPKAPLRPQLIHFKHCQNITVKGITLKNAASWVQTYLLSKNIIIDHITVESDTYWNNDGIDIVDCQNVTITNSFINASDDGICIKSVIFNKTEKQLCDSIYIANCVIRSSASAIKFGTWSYSGFKNVVVKNIKVFDTFRSAIALEVIDGGTMENVLIDNVKAVNTGNAIFIRLGRKYDHREVGRLENVTIKNIKAKISLGSPDHKYKIRGPALPFFHNTFPSSITGIPGYPVKNLTLENIKITYPGRGYKAYANLPLSRVESVPEKINDYPEFSMFGELPAWGFYVRHAEGLQFKNIKVKIKKADYRPAFVFDDVKNLEMESINISGDKKENPIFLNKVKGAKIEELKQ